MENTIRSTSVSVGDIFYDSWGYSMTIIDFYKVVRVTKSSVWVVGLASKETPDGYLSGTSMPSDIEDSRNGVMRIRDGYITGTMHNLYDINFDSTRKVHLSKWDGRPKYYNHCD